MPITDLVPLGFAGAESGGLEEMNSSGGTPTADSGTKRTGGFSYLIQEGDDVRYSGGLQAASKNGFNWFLWFDAAPSGTEIIVRIFDAATTIIADIQMNSSGQLIFRDVGGTTLATSAALATSTWHSIRWNLENSDSGDSYSKVNGTEVVSSTTVDHHVANTIFGFIRFLNPASSGITNMRVDDLVAVDWSGAGAVKEDLLPDGEVLGFNTTHAATDTDIGSAPTGNWSNVAELPPSDSNLCVFDSVGSAKFMDQTTGDGPQGSADIDGDQHIVAAKFWHRMASGNGQGKDHHSVLGHDGNTTTTTALSVTLQEDARILSGTPADFFTITTDPLFMPGVNQHAAIGVGKDATGGQDTELYEAMCMILHVPRPTPTTPTNLSDLNFGQQNSYHGPYQTV